MSQADENTPLNGSGGSGAEKFLTCKTAFGCAPISVGMMIVLGIDLVAFIVLLVSFVLCNKDGADAQGGSLSMANSIFFLVAGLLLAGAVFVKSRTVANICVLSGLFFHVLLILLLLVQWTWQAANWASTGNCLGIDTCETIKFGYAWGFFCSLILFFLNPHLCQIINTWRLDIVGHSGMGAALKESMNDDRDQKQSGFGSTAASPPVAKNKSNNSINSKKHSKITKSNQSIEHPVDENEIANQV